MESLGVGEVLLRLTVAAVAGLLIGFERERREKTAGLRTLALVSSGSAVLVLGAILVAPAEAVRMAAGIITGVGFLGAGAILRDKGEVIGLTTAATVWIVAGLGISAALGAFALTVSGTVLSLLILAVIGSIDLRPLQHDERTYEVTYAGPEWDEKNATRCLTDTGLEVYLLSIVWSEQGVIAAWRVGGSSEQHQEGIASLRESPSIVSFGVKT